MKALRSLGAVLAGVLAGAVPAVATDLALKAAGAPEMFTDPLFLLATLYRTVYGIAGAYVTARLAPSHPMGHALALGLAGLVASIVGTVVGWSLGHHWYPLALVALAVPTAWAGGHLRVKQLSARSV